ncbi:MAG: hypothetical protein LBE24_00100 [Methylobacillus sp.]|jgi:uncharacterized membrane protein|nr:hypothetical protein [Methylobacillus sp.]
MEARKVNAGNGWEWIAGGFQLFKKSPGIWIAIFLIYMALSVVLAFVPFAVILSPVLMGGLMLACHEQDRGEELKIEHLFAGFQTNLGQLAIIGAILFAIGIAFTIAMYIVMIVMVVGASVAASGDPASMGAGFMLVIALIMLIFMALMIPVMMAYIYAPALVILKNMSAFDALKASFKACWRNILPWLVYGIIAFVLTIIAYLPLFLGMLVMGPVLIGSMYASYKDVFNIDNADQALPAS